MAREEPKVYIRLPQELKDQLHALAAENKRSVNAEMVAAIEMVIGLHQLEKDIGVKGSFLSNPDSENKYLISEAELKSIITEVTSRVISRLK